MLREFGSDKNEVAFDSLSNLNRQSTEQCTAHNRVKFDCCQYSSSNAVLSNSLYGFYRLAAL